MSKKATQPIHYSADRETETSTQEKNGGTTTQEKNGGTVKPRGREKLGGPVGLIETTRERMKDYRHKKRISQAALGMEMNCSEDTIQKYESGAKPIPIQFMENFAAKRGMKWAEVPLFSSLNQFTTDDSDASSVSHPQFSHIEKAVEEADHKTLLAELIEYIAEREGGNHHTPEAKFVDNVVMALLWYLAEEE